MRKRIVKSRKKIKRTTGAPRKKSGTKGGATKGAPVGQEESRALTLYERGEIYREDSADTRADAEKEDIGAFDDTPSATGEGSEKRGDILRLVCGFVVIFSLFSAVVLTCFAFAVATEYSKNGETVDADADVDADTDAESGKVVFVRPDYDGSGVLTAPELYAKCADSTVSISTVLPLEAGGGKGVGSGFILSEDGYVATAYHTVSAAEEITVVLSDGREYGAELVAGDGASDIALLHIEAEGLSAVELGASSDLLAGERIYTIGTPASLDYAGTLSSGEVACPQRVVSVYGEGVKTLEKKLKLIQITARVSKGNSGCPIFDEYGRVVGMVTMGLGEEYSGIGFALPSDGLARVLQAMGEGRELDSATLSGVVIFPPRLGITGESAEVGGTYGYRIDGITGNGSGALGALKVGDLIVEIDKRIITTEADITETVEKKTPGDTVSITVLRSGQRLTFNIVLGN